MTPQNYTIVSGQGEGNYALVAFDKALLNAGIGDYNLVKVSSIIPPFCTFKDTIDLPKGSIIYAAYANVYALNKEIGSTAVAIALPEHEEENGVIFETSCNDNNAEETVKRMCIEAMVNRDRPIKDILCSSTIVHGNPGKYTCGISAVVMW